MVELLIRAGANVSIQKEVSTATHSYCASIANTPVSDSLAVIEFFHMLISPQGFRVYPPDPLAESLGDESLVCLHNWPKQLTRHQH